MKFFKSALTILLSTLTLVSCAGGNSNSGPAPGNPNPGFNLPPGVNVMRVTVNGSLCDPNSQYLNEPCTSVTICEPGTSNCQTINNILVDTGSYGLRIFSSAINLALPSVGGRDNSTLAECVTFGTGADWGSVKTADVVLGSLTLGGEKASNVSLHVIDDTFSNFQNNQRWCNNGDVDSSPATAGFNGILGVGVFKQDCGSDCDPNYGNDSANGMYFACENNTCVGTTAPLAQQVTDPVSLLSSDNNGVTIVFPSISTSGVVGLDGAMILGIGTESNNTPSNTAIAFQADSNYGEMKTVFNGKISGAIFDSGTNSLSFDDSSLAECNDNSSFYCPQNSTTLSATLENYNGANQVSTQFTIVSLDNLSNQNWVFSNVGSVMGENGRFFIWGIPYFYGKTVFIGFEQSQSPIGTGPYFGHQ